MWLTFGNNWTQTLTVSIAREAPMIELSAAYAKQARYFEMKFLSAGLHYPAAAYDAAAIHQLTTLSFAYPVHRLAFGWICELAERGRALSEEEFCYLNDLAGRPFAVPFERDEFYWSEPWPTGLDVWAKRVAKLVSVRNRVEAMKTETTELLREVVCPAA